MASSPRASSSLRRAPSSLSSFARCSRHVPAVERNESHVWFKAGFASKPYSRVAEDLVFCFLLVVVVVVVAVCSCLSSSSSLRSRDECHVWFRVGFRPQTFSPGLLKLGLLCFFRAILVFVLYLKLASSFRTWEEFPGRTKVEESRCCGPVAQESALLPRLPAWRVSGIGRLCTPFGRRTTVGNPGFGFQPYHCDKLPPCL